MLDLVVVAMVLVVACLGFSISQVRRKFNPKVHQILQLAIATILLVTLIAFEVDMQYLTEWEELAKPSPFYDSGVVHGSLWIHLLFAIPTPFVWAAVIFYAMRKFPKDYQAETFNKVHRRWGMIAAILMVLTAITGWIFYVLAFVA